MQCSSIMDLLDFEFLYPQTLMRFFTVLLSSSMRSFLILSKMSSIDHHSSTNLSSKSCVNCHSVVLIHTIHIAIDLQPNRVMPSPCQYLTQPSLSAIISSAAHFVSHSHATLPRMQSQELFDAPWCPQYPF